MLAGAPAGTGAGEAAMSTRYAAAAVRTVPGEPGEVLRRAAAVESETVFTRSLRVAYRAPSGTSAKRSSAANDAKVLEIRSSVMLHLQGSQRR